eukprot:scaffold3141_cov121-Isochrysis_galbana.AAC.1
MSEWTALLAGLWCHLREVLLNEREGGLAGAIHAQRDDFLWSETDDVPLHEFRDEFGVLGLAGGVQVQGLDEVRADGARRDHVENWSALDICPSVGHQRHACVLDYARHLSAD